MLVVHLTQGWATLMMERATIFLHSLQWAAMLIQSNISKNSRSLKTCHTATRFELADLLFLDAFELENKIIFSYFLLGIGLLIF